jgi:hypothetical protein
MRRFNGDVCSCRTHRDTYVRLCQRRRVVHAVAYHHNGMPLCLICLHDGNLVFRKKTGLLPYAELSCNRRGNALIIAREQLNVAEAETVHLSKGGGNFRAKSIRGGQDSAERTLASEEQ